MDNKKNSDKQQLRDRAEKYAKQVDKCNIAQMSTDDIALLLYELQTHQIELEMQNEDLRTTQVELVEMRDQYAELYDFAPIGYITLSKKGLILQSNLTFSEMLGLPRSELANHRLSEFIVKEDQDIYYTNLKMAIDAPGKHNFELRLRAQTNSFLWVKLDFICIENPNGACDRIRLVISDISHRKQAEAEQAHLQLELQQAQKMEAIGILAGGIAHDFNNILAIIMGYSELALAHSASKGDAKQAKHLKKILMASGRAKDLVAKIKTFSRNKAIFEKPLLLQSILKEDIQMLGSILPSSIEINFEIDENAPAIQMDPVQLNQILMNLCINARDAMNGKGNIDIRLSSSREVNEECILCIKQIEGDWVELSITDTGSGIKPDILNRIFDPFYTTKEVGKGTGMGLSVIRGIMLSHGGHIIVETEIGKGSTFRLLFPPVVENGDKTDDIDELKEKLPNGYGERILVLDDEQILGSCLGDILESHGYMATVMSDSQEAMERFKHNPDEFALIITDQTMPGITGVELVKTAREISPDMPIILNTGFSDAINPETAAKLGISYLEKPVSAKSLLQTIDELLITTRQSTK